MTAKHYWIIGIVIAMFVSTFVGLVLVAKPVRNIIADRTVIDDAIVKQKQKPSDTVVIRPTTTVNIAAINKMYSDYNAKLPTARYITTCAAYACRAQSKLDLTPIKSKLFDLFADINTAQQERDAISAAIVMFEHYVGSTLGTSKDRAGSDVFGAGDRAQMDSVDESINTTSLLLVLHQQGKIKFHNIEGPYWKISWLVTYFTAVVVDTTTNTKWAIDSSVADNGKPPLIVKLSEWGK